MLEPVTRSDSIGWIPLATQTDPIDFKSAFEVPAWGYKDDSKLMVLKKIDVAYKPNMACKMPYQAAIICVSLFKNADTLMKVSNIPSHSFNPVILARSCETSIPMQDFREISVLALIGFRHC